jgi:hypothetical protein
MQGETETHHRTIITPVLDCPIGMSKNVVWCATFQVAWDGLRESEDEQIATEPTLGIVSALNREHYDITNLPPGQFVRATGLIRDGILDDIRDRMSNIPGFPQPSIPSGASMDPDAVVAYAYLTRSLSYATPFEKIRTISDSKGKEIRFWGIDGYVPKDEVAIARGQQVKVIWHRYIAPAKVDMPYQEEFVVELATQEGDRLVLAAIRSRKTLGRTIAAVLSKCRVPNKKLLSPHNTLAMPPELLAYESLDSSTEADVATLLASLSHYSCLIGGDRLEIPQLTIDQKQTFDQLIGVTITAGRHDVRGKRIMSASQRICLEMNEEGTHIESEAEITLFGPPAARNLVFDRPFLVMLMRSGADIPYFAGWIVNAGR